MKETKHKRQHVFRWSSSDKKQNYSDKKQTSDFLRSGLERRDWLQENTKEFLFWWELHYCIHFPNSSNYTLKIRELYWTQIIPQKVHTKKSTCKNQYLSNINITASKRFSGTKDAVLDVLCLPSTFILFLAPPCPKPGKA